MTALFAATHSGRTSECAARGRCRSSAATMRAHRFGGLDYPQAQGREAYSTSVSDRT
jgi:hypothetical protein